MSQQKSARIFERLYRKASKPEDLPWHRPEPPALLTRALAARPTPGRALDVGCGAGTYCLYLAEHGYAVTGVDMVPRAVQMLSEAAASRHLDVRAVQADVLTWSDEGSFDVVLDVGCLHSLGNRDRTVYRQQLLRWLAPGGDFILVHCGRRAWWDAWPLGPRRVYRREIATLFAPELELREYAEELLSGLPLFVGGSALSGRYWFRRVAAG